MASALLQVYQHFGTTYCLHLYSIFLRNAEKLPTSHHTAVNVTFSEVASQISQLLFDDYQMLPCNWQHLLPGHLGYDALLQSRFAVSFTHQPTAWIMTAMDATHIAKVGKIPNHCS